MLLFYMPYEFGFLFIHSNNAGRLASSSGANLRLFLANLAESKALPQPVSHGGRTVTISISND